MNLISITRLYGHTKVKVAHFDDYNDRLDIIALARAIDSKSRAARFAKRCAANRGEARRIYHGGRVVTVTNGGGL